LRLLAAFALLVKRGDTIMSISKNQKPIDTGLGARPEADEILDGIDLSGKTVLVTGGYSGIGLETVRALVKAGAHVHVPARRKAQARDMLDGIIAPEQIGDMDLGDLPSVEKFAADFLSQHDKLDILIGNAAVMACPMAHTAQGFESQIGINHFGHFTLIKGLMPALKNAGQADGARVVLLSSIGHRIAGIDFDDMHFKNRPYDKWQSYGQSKTAKALQAVELDARGAGDNIRSFSVHPGGIFTPLQRHLQNEEMVALGWTNEDGSPSEMAAAGFKSPTQGAGTTLFAATSPKLNGMGGLYLNDCNIAEAVPADSNDMNGVRPWAADQELAAKLWDETEKQIAAL
jgi:NAD(P)-dependent dehydrogenase (short-subunit alcohol dehydrogenase family)